MTARGYAVAILLLLTAAASGCMDQRGSLSRPKSFTTIDAPTWDAGQVWTYDVRQTFVASDDTIDAPAGRSTFTMSVFNDSAKYHGRPVYFIETSGDGSHPMFMTPIAAIDRKTFDLVATGYPMGGGFTTEDGCSLGATVTPTDTDEAIPMYFFPLDAGRQWAGSVRLPGLPEMTYVARVIGEEKVRLRSGDTEAVRVSATFTPRYASEEAQSFGLHLETWYSPQVENFVAHELEFRLVLDDDRRYDFSSRFELVDLSFDAAIVRPAPVEDIVAHVPPPLQTRNFLIVAPEEQEWPVDISEGSAMVRLGLVEVASEPYGPVEAGPYPATTGLPSGGVGDGLRVRWHVDDESIYQDDLEREGDEMSLLIDHGGLVTVRAYVETTGCSGQVVGKASAIIPVRQVFHTVHPGQLGTGGNHDLGYFYLDGPTHSVTVEWTRQNPNDPLPDQGRPRLLDPDRRVHLPGDEEGSRAWFYPSENPGLWQLRWTTEGLQKGDRLEFDVIVDYGGPV